MKSLAITAILMISSIGFAQTTPSTPVTQQPNMVKIGVEGDTVNALADGSIIQFGSSIVGGNCIIAWQPSTTYKANNLPVPFEIYYTNFGGDAQDPAPSCTKELDVQQGAVAQTVLVTKAGASSPTSILIPALPAAAPKTNSCSTDNTSCTTGHRSSAAFIITTAGQTDLSPQETQTLKSALAKVESAHEASVEAEADLQTIQKTIAAAHEAPVNGPYEINTDFATSISQIPPVPVAITTSPTQ